MSRLLLVRTDRGLWGVPEEAVLRIRRAKGGYRIGLGNGEEIAASEVIDRVEATVRPVGEVGRRFLAAGVRGLAVHGGAVLAVIDPSSPPGALGTQDPVEVRKGGAG